MTVHCISASLYNEMVGYPSLLRSIIQTILLSYLFWLYVCVSNKDFFKTILPFIEFLFVDDMCQKHNNFHCVRFICFLKFKIKRGVYVSIKNIFSFYNYQDYPLIQSCLQFYLSNTCIFKSNPPSKASTSFFTLSFHLERSLPSSIFPAGYFKPCAYKKFFTTSSRPTHCKLLLLIVINIFGLWKKYICLEHIFLQDRIFSPRLIHNLKSQTILTN